MSRTNAAETAYLTLLFINTSWANIGDATGLVKSTADGVFYISLHTADPGEAGDQTTSEATYTPYARVSVARGAAQWTVAGTTPTTVDNDNVIPFAEATAGSETITHVGIGTDASGAGNLLWSGALDTSRAVSSGITPSFAAGELNVTAD